jgi:hypothetical protein
MWYSGRRGDVAVPASRDALLPSSGCVGKIRLYLSIQHGGDLPSRRSAERWQTLPCGRYGSQRSAARAMHSRLCCDRRCCVT